MNNPLISIILPVYNAEKYLCQCLDSILAQTFNDWECIIVEDGSTDESGRICDEYVVKDMRFTVYHKENGGVSSARNLGIEKMEGEWVYFCDADDLLYRNTLELFLKFAQYGIDSVCGGYIKIDSEGYYLSSSARSEYSLSVDRDEALIDFYNHKWGEMFNGYLWNRLLKSDVIKNYSIKFKDDIYIKEDGLFLVEFLCKSHGLHHFMSTPIYKYRQNTGGAMMTFNHEFDNKAISNLYARCFCYDHITKSTYNKSLIELAKDSIASRFFVLLSRGLRNQKKEWMKLKRMMTFTFKYISPYYLLKWEFLRKIRQSKRAKEL